MQTALEGLDGVSSVDVSFENGTAVVSYNEEKLTLDQIVEAVSEGSTHSQFKATIIRSVK